MEEQMIDCSGGCGNKVYLHSLPGQCTGCLAIESRLREKVKRAEIKREAKKLKNGNGNHL